MASEALLPPPVAAAPLVEQPYKYLDYFTDSKTDQRRFGGREGEIRELVARITGQRTLVLYGRSGIGKTSLLLAGLFPELRAEGYQPVHARTLTAPVDNLAEAIRRQCKLPESAGDETLAQLAARAGAAGPLALVLDQFEEFFTRFREEPRERSRFIAAIAELVQDRGLDLTVVFSLRQEYLAELDDFRTRLPDLFANEYRLRALSAFGVRQAIARPLLDSGVGYEEAVVSRLVDLLEPAGFDPPLLQILCSELWKEAASRTPAGETPRITLEDLKRVGDLKSVFQRYLDGVIQAIPAQHHLLARILLDSLITPEKTKQAALLEDLVQNRESAEDRSVEEVLDLMARHSLLRRQEREGREWIELIHESLIPYVDEWLGRDPQFRGFRQARAFIRNNSDSDIWVENPQALLDKKILTDLLDPYREQFRLSRREVEFVLRSAIYRRTDGVAFWARCYGRADALELLLALLGAERAADRRGAVAAAGQLAEAKDLLLPHCLELAVADPDPKVRREAAKTVARLAPEDDLHALLLKQNLPHPYLGEALSHLSAAKHRLCGFGRLARAQAQLRALLFLRQEHGDAIRARRRLGFQNGALAGAAWTGAALALTGLAQLPHYSRKDWIESLGFAPWLLLPGALLGLLLGWLSATAVAKHAAWRGGEGRWGRALALNLGLLAGALTMALPVEIYGEASLSSLSKLVGLSSSAPSVSVLLFALVAQLALGLAVGLAAPAVDPRGSRAGIWFWSLVASFGLPVLLPVAAAELFARLRFLPDSLTATFLLTAPVASFASAVALVALSLSVRRSPIGELPAVDPDVGKRRRLLCAVAALVTVFGVVYLGWRVR